MKAYIFLGRETAHKTKLLLYVSSAINRLTDSNICLVTGNRYYKQAENPYEYSLGLDIYHIGHAEDVKQILCSSYDFLVFDLSQTYMEALSDILTNLSDGFLITDQLSESITFNNRLAKKYQDNIPNLNLILWPMEEESKIGLKQLRVSYEKAYDIKASLACRLNSKDRGLIIDDGHQDFIRFKPFSQEFKGFIANICDLMIGHESMKKKTILKELSRRP